MRITILALGTRGDVQPAVALALALSRAGHTMRVAAPPLSEELVRGHGLEYAPLGGPPKGGQQISFLGVLSFTARVVYLFARSFISRRSAPIWPVKTPDLKRLMDHSWKACEGADAIISPFITIWVYHIAEKMRVPCYLWDTHPMTPTRAFPSFLFTGIFPAWFALAKVLPSWFRAGGGFNALTHRMIQRLLLNIGLRLTNTWRGEKLQLPLLKNISSMAKFYNESAVVLYCYSPLTISVPADWPPFHYVTGYWFLDSANDWQPPAELLSFLAAGSPPVCIGFGSSRDRNPERLTKIVLAALARTGYRGILLTGRGGMMTTDLPRDVFMAESIPHDWLFRRVAAVVHHGGAGTCGAVLRAGVPSVVVPWWGDMHFWADCLHKLGVSPPALPKRRLSAENLAAAIQRVVNDTNLRSRALAIAEQIEAEDGVSRAVVLFEEHL